jgi:Predicted hydrolases or acyltransferases (alpha/beta hydrolase superfamily)
MLWNAQNGVIKLGNTDMDYISFGHGQKTLILIPGLGDGLKTVKGTAFAMAMLYKEYGKNHKVYVFSRKNKLEENTSTRNMAEDQREAMKKLEINNAYVVGISQGGMIAQYLAIDYPEVVDKLVLAVTLSRPNEMATHVIGQWLKMAAANDYKRLLIDTIEKSYTEKRKQKYRLLYPILTKIGKPKDFNRFIIQANAILCHNAYDELEKIKCPTLVIGADGDAIVGVQASRDIADKIVDSKLMVYAGLGHGAYEEAKDFNEQVLKFLKM